MAKNIKIGHIPNQDKYDIGEYLFKPTKKGLETTSIYLTGNCDFDNELIRVSKNFFLNNLFKFD